jgi:hypothetical protein
MAKVFIPSLRFRKNDNGEYAPVFDTTLAEKYGEVVFLTTPGNAPVNQMAIDLAANVLSDKVTDKDYILLSGDMVLFAVVVAQMAHELGFARILRWEPRDNKYLVEEWQIPCFDFDEED